MVSPGKRRGAILLLVAVVLTLGTVMPAHADSTRVVCEANGTADQALNPDGSANWTLRGLGTCVDTLQGPWLVSLQGKGTSKDLGICSRTLVMSNLNLSVAVTTLNLKTGFARTYAEAWASPISEFPIAAPFFIQSGPGSPGAGAILTRLLGNCPPGGVHTATFVWTQIAR